MWRIRSSRPELSKKETQVFSCEFCEISKNTFSDRASPVAASDLFVLIFMRNGPFFWRQKMGTVNGKT